MHERTAIRAAIVLALKNATLSELQGRVFKRRTKPFRQTELPAINVYFTDEPIAESSRTSAPRKLTREAVFNIDFFQANTESEDLDDLNDDAALKIERVMDNPATFDGITIRECILAATESGIVVNGSLPMSCIHLEFAITYRTDVRAPAPTNNFNELGVKTQTDTQTAESVRTGIHQGGI